jgi:Ran GTPase-activating protein (RanGAP) involved in mRNA processing and transport
MNLLEVSHMQELRYLLLNQVKLSAKFFKAIKKDHNLMSLTHLQLWYCDFKPMSMSLLKAITQANLPSLRSLNMGQNYMGAQAGEVFAKAKNWSALRDLDLANNALTSEGVHALCNAPFFSELESLNLGLNRTGDEGVGALLDASPPQLQKLGLEHNGITDQGVDALIGSTLLPRLRTLDLRDNEISPEALARLRKAHPKLTLV